MTRSKPDRAWFSAAAMTAWGAVVTVMLLGGILAWVWLGASLCEDAYSPGSDGYCNQGGWEGSGLVLGVLAVTALLVPATGAATGDKRLFWIGLLSPPALAVASVLLAASLGKS
jgi:hypothetical protein